MVGIDRSENFSHRGILLTPSPPSSREKAPHRELFFRLFGVTADDGLLSFYLRSNLEVGENALTSIN